MIYPDGSAHLTSTGGLAGSTLNINKGLKILVEDAMVPFNYALNACTINPARCLHLDDRKGSIQVGKDATLWCWRTTTMCSRPIARVRQSCKILIQ